MGTARPFGPSRIARPAVRGPDAMIAVVRFLSRALDKTTVALAFTAGAAVFALAFLIVTDIVARRLFAFSVQGTDELGGYVLAMVGSLGLAFVLAERGFTRIDLTVRLLPQPVRNLLHAAAYLTLAGVAVFFATQALLELEETWLFDTHANTPLQTPLWIPQGLWMLGMSLFALCAVIHAVRCLVLLVIASDRVERAYGFAKVEEEVEAFQRAAERQTTDAHRPD